jgi:acyl-ACP thioesterase
MNGSVHRRSFFVHSYEADPGGHLSPRALCAYLQEAAGEDATRLGVSMSRLGEGGLAWVLYRLRLEVRRYPRTGETLTAATWARRFDYAVAWRDFEVLDESGAGLAVGTSRWVVVDLAARRLTRLPEFVRAVPVADRPGVVEREPGPLAAVETAAVARRFEVRRGDLDMLRHVNNTRYVEWALETVPSAVLEECRPSVVDVEFRREALLGDAVVSRASGLDAEGRAFAHQLWNESSGVELARAESRWG